MVTIAANATFLLTIKTYDDHEKVERLKMTVTDPFDRQRDAFVIEPTNELIGCSRHLMNMILGSYREHAQSLHTTHIAIIRRAAGPH
jgi:hypothetical protein